MIFTKIDPGLSPKLVEEAKQRFTQLACDLAVKKDNYHVGSGLGGNTLQLCLLHEWSHQLRNVARKIDLQDGEIIWDAQFLAHVRMSVIRKRLDRFIPRVIEESKNWVPSRQLFIAMETCDTLARLLDAGYISDVHITDAGKKMQEFPPEIVLVAVRTKLRISRLVKYNLDEHPAWADLLTKINKTVDAN